MNIIESFRDVNLAKTLLDNIRSITTRPVRIMEVCGGHTMVIRRHGIHTLLPESIELLSGPGCPVCVTDQEFIDKAVAYAKLPDTILLTYGDLIRVPGSFSSLDREKATGCDIRIIYSTLQALDIARNNPDKQVIFAAIGFETTIPATAIAILTAKKEGLHNFFILSAHKIMPPAMTALLEEGIPINGYIGPGHVSTISGSKIFKPLAEKYKIPVVISGFEAVDLLQSILLLIQSINEQKSGVIIQYNRLVSEQGNLKAQSITNKVFESCTVRWRGLGPIEGSGLTLKKKYKEFDAESNITVSVKTGPEPKGCICGQVLKGLKKPGDCALFGKKCSPSNPVGACMVSAEGACQTYYLYREP